MVRSLWKKFLIWLTRTRFYFWLLKSVIPYIRFSMYYTSFRGWKYHDGYKLLEPGDIILTSDSKKLTTLLIGGTWTHAAQCVGKFGTSQYPGFEVAEMTHNDFTRSHFFDLCKESDRVAIIRCNDYDKEYIEKLIERCLSFRDAEYDIDFDLGVTQLYCSELCYQADFERRLKVDLSDLAGLGTQYISPTGLREAENITVVWDSSRLIGGL